MDSINLSPQAADQPTVNIDTSGNAGPVSPDTASNRAAKIQFGLSGVLGNPSHQDLYHSILDGQEQSIRYRASAGWDIQNSQAHQAQVRQAALEGNQEALRASIQNAPKPVNPDGVVEHGVGLGWVGSLFDVGNNLGQTDFHEAAKEEPDWLAPLGRLGSETIAKAELVAKHTEDAYNANQGQSWMGWALNEAKGFIPGYAEYKLRGNVPGTGIFTGGGLGSNVEEQARRLNLEPWDQFQKDYPRIHQYLLDSDPALALQLDAALQHPSTTDQVLNDLFSAGQFVPLPAGKAVMGLFRSAATDAMKDLAKSAFKTQFSLEGVIPRERALVVTGNMPTEFPLNTAGKVPYKAAVAESAGDVRTAGTERLASELDEDMKGPANPIMRAVQALSRNFRVDSLKLGDDIGDASRENVLRIQEQYGDSNQRLIDNVLQTMRTMRVNLQTASRATIEAVQNDIKRRYPGWSGRVFNMTDPQLNPVTNTWHMGMDLWDGQGQMYPRKEQALRAANLLDLDSAAGEGYEIRNKGAGYYIRLYKNVDESMDPLRDMLIGTDKDRSPKGWLNALIGFARTPEDTMARTETTGRRLATYPINNFLKMVEPEAKRISDLSQGIVRVDAYGNNIPKVRMKVQAWGRTYSAKKSWGEWKRVYDLSRRIPDSNNENIPGTTFKTVGEFQRFFFQTVKRPPTVPEIEAYFAKSRLDLYDYTFRNMAMYTNKASLGAETIRLFGVAPGEKGIVKSAPFDAIPLKDLNPIIGGGNHSILYIGDNGVGGDIRENWGKLSQFHNKDDELKKLVEQGRIKAYEVWAPEQRLLSGFGNIKDERIRFILAKNVETSPLTWNQVPRRGGGHFDYDYNHYVKQARIRGDGSSNWYEGDETLGAVDIRKLGKNYADIMNQVREALLAKNEALAQKIVESKLDTNWKEVKGWFTPTNKPARFSLEEPFQVVPKDQLIMNIDDQLEKRYVNFRNGLREGSKNMQFQVNYTGERDARGLFEINDVGTRNNPIYQTAPAELVDPMETMTRGLNRIIHSTFMNDYKRYAVTHWMKEIEGDPTKNIPGYMNVSEAPFIKSAPFYYFSNPQLVFAKAVPEDFKRSMMDNWHKINQFIGQPSSFDTYIHGLTQHFMDVTYDSLGPKAALVPAWLLGKVKDPVQFVRAMAYHAFLGMFNPAQWLVQNQTWTNIWAISPRAATWGTTAHMLHRWARINASDEIMQALDGISQKLGGRPGEFIEARRALARTGFEHVEGEQAMLDTPMDYSFLKGDMKNFLDLGQMFFKDGVRNVRLGAWYTAFREFRNANPTAKLTESNIQEILNVADRYHANMSRASTSRIQRGVMSLPLQFSTYMIRLPELVLGKRLGDTPQERWLARGRLVAAYSALYGVPISVGLTGLPLSDYFRKSALDNGYVVGDQWYKTAFWDGVPSMAVGQITGNHYNIGGRFGAKGVDFLKDFYQVLSGDLESQEILGAGYSVAIPAMTAFGHLIYNMGRGQGTLSDVADIAKIATGPRQAWKFYEAAKYGEWKATNEGIESKDVGLGNALWMAATGLQPQFQSDQFLMGQIMHERDQYYSNAQKEYQKEIRRMIDAAKDNNDTLAGSFYDRAQQWLSRIPVQMRAGAMKKAYESNLPQADKIIYNFYRGRVPPGTEQEHYDAYQRLRELREQGIQ